MKWLALAPAAFAIATGVSQGQMFGPGAGARGMSFAIEQQADAGAYYVVVHHAGFAPQDLRVVPMPSGFFVEAHQSTGGGAPGFGAFSMNQFSQWVGLPPDADVSCAQRRDESGRIMIAVPRRPAGLW